MICSASSWRIGLLCSCILVLADETSSTLSSLTSPVSSSSAGMTSLQRDVAQQRRYKEALASGVIPKLDFQNRKSHKQNLVRYLLDDENYDRRVLPSRDQDRGVTIKLKMSLYQLLDVIEPTQTVEVYTWITQYWQDEYLGWEPSDFGGITRLVLPYDTVWLPDTYLYNSVVMSRDSSERWMSVILDTDNSTSPPVANITFMYPTIYRFSCKLFIKYFPFDKQNCTMTFGSWTYDASGISFDKFGDTVAMESFVPNEEWKILSFTWEREVLTFSCCPNPWILMHANLIIQRKPLYYLVNLVLPSAIITMVATVGFFMPATTTGERTEKVNLGITTLLAMAILLLMVSDAMPTTSNFIPLLGWFYLNVILLTSIGTLLTSVVIWIQNQARFGEPVWSWIRRPIFWPLAKFLNCPARPALIGYWLRHGYSQYGVKLTEHALGNAIVAAQRQSLNLVANKAQKPRTLTMETVSDQHDYSDCKSPVSGDAVSGYEETPMSIVDDTLHTKTPVNEHFLPQYEVNGKDHRVQGHRTNGTLVAIGRRASSEHHHRDNDLVMEGGEKQWLGDDGPLDDLSPLEAVELEWEHLADVLDRFLLIIFTLAVVGVTSSIFVTGIFLNEGSDVELL